MCEFPLFSKMCSHCIWIVPSHSAEYYFKALTTGTSLLHTGQMPCLSILAFQMSYAQHHVMHNSKHQSHLPLPVVIGCQAVQCQQDRCIYDTDNRGQSQCHGPEPQGQSQDHRGLGQGWGLEAPRDRGQQVPPGQGHGFEDSNTDKNMLWHWQVKENAKNKNSESDK